MLKKFKCVEGCSDCCINREYFPSKEFGKIGVLLLPKEKKKIEHLAETKKVNIKILPRIGVGMNDKEEGPESILVYQLMGRERDGNICPFLETNGPERSPHGGARCTIYDERPAACKAYPLVNIDPTISTLDSKCSYCVSTNENKVCNLGLVNEIQALNEIMVATSADEDTHLWRYATNVGDRCDERLLLPEGWIKDETN
ncbi:MAG: YkgJ family cysteine cluster protein [Nitrososphaeraceae archaeon]